MDSISIYSSLPVLKCDYTKVSPNETPYVSMDEFVRDDSSPIASGGCCNFLNCLSCLAGVS